MQKLIEYKIKKKFDDRIEYYYNGERHRLNGPAIEYANGNKYQHQNGKLHRNDGPAIEIDGDKLWYKNGELHRNDGPAVERKNGDKEWWVNNIQYIKINSQININGELFILKKKRNYNYE